MIKYSVIRLLDVLSKTSLCRFQIWMSLSTVTREVSDLVVCHTLYYVSTHNFGKDYITYNSSYKLIRRVSLLNGCALSASSSSFVCSDLLVEHQFRHLQWATFRSVCYSLCVPRVGPGHPSSPLSIYFLIFSPLLLFPFFHWLYLFSSFVHPFPFYQNSPTPFPGRRS